MGSKTPNVEKWLSIAGFLLVSMGAYVYASLGTDNRIESSVKSSHVFQTYLKDDAIDVESKGGAVTLTGTVSDASHKTLAADTVENISGVKSVNDKLAIKGEPSEEKSDLWIGTKVKTALLFHRNVNGLKTQVEVKEGVVSLRGDAESAAQKELTTEYAKDIDGVKNVNNEMVVTPSETPKESMSEKIDDASITAQAKMVLLYHRSTSALKTKVKTNDGVVLLSGKAQNASEKDLATKLVEDIHGVRNVRNEMTIASGK